MSLPARGRSALPLVASVGLLVLVIGAAVLPNLGIVAAQSNCQYSTCTASTPSYTVYYAVLAVLAILAVALGILLLMRRRGGGRSPGPLTEAEPATGGPGGPDGPSMSDDSAVVDAGAAGAVGATVAASPTVPPGAGGAAYLEGPEDVGAVPPTAAVAAAGAGAGAAAQGGNEDIDSLMQELDKISGEILKRPPVKKDGASATDGAADDAARSA